MNNWSVLELPEAYWFQEGPGVRKWQFTSSGIKLLNVANITSDGILDLSKTDRYLDECEVDQKYKHFLADAGDLVIASSGISFDDDNLLRTRGAFVEQANLPLCMNTSTIRFKPKQSKYSLAFLKHWLDSDEFRGQISRRVTGSAQQNFGPSHLNELYISLPPLPEQQRLAAILDKADHLRRTRRYAHQLSDTFLQSVFWEMFGDPATNPKGWDIVTVEETLSKSRSGTQSGPFGSSLKRHEYVADGIPVWGINNVKPNEFIEDEPLYITAAKYQQLTNYSVEVGDILISRAGTTGRMCVARPIQSPSIIGTNLVRVSLDYGKMVPDYFTALFTYLPDRVGSLRTSDDENAYSFLNPSNLRLLRVPLPPLALQKQFAHVVWRTRHLQRRQQEAARQSEHLFQTLLFRAFRGEV